MYMVRVFGGYIVASSFRHARAYRTAWLSGILAG
jgi:hypothetical protein